MSLDVKGFLKQLFGASESDKDGIFAEFQGDVEQARLQLVGAEQALVMVRGMLGRAVEPASSPAPLNGTKLNGQPSGTRRLRNGSASIADQELVTVFDLIQGGVGKIGDLMAKTGQDRLQLKKLLGVMSDRGLVEMTGYKGGARYHLKPGAVRPMTGESDASGVSPSSSASSGESDASTSSPASSDSSKPDGASPGPEASAAHEPSPSPSPSPLASPSPSSEPTHAPGSSAARTESGATPEPSNTPVAPGPDERDSRAKGNRRPQQPQHARR